MSTAVDQLADSLAAATVQDPTGTSSPTENGVLASAAEGRRLYIGNLAYATTEGELKEFFSTYDVENTSIPVNPRTNRPVGYAFVDLTTAKGANKAISDLSGKEILERKVSVQLARKPELAGEKTTTDTVSGGEGASGSEARKRGSTRGRGRGRGRGGRARGGARGAAETGDAVTEQLPLTDVTNENNKAATTDATGKTTRAPRQPKQRGPPEDGVPSTTKVMVANLPYDLSEEKLKEMFTSYEPSAAKIALRPIPRFMVKKLQARNEPRKGRGFGFVTLASEEMQQKAVSEMNGKEIEGREIAVKVAIDSPGKEDNVEEMAKVNGAGENGTTEDTPAAAA